MQSYLITDPAYYTQSPTDFKRVLISAFKKHTPDLALYRDKESSIYPDLAKIFISVCQEYKVKAFLHQEIALAKALGAEGVHLTSKQFEMLPKAKAQGLLVIASTHSEEEIEDAAQKGADMVTYSPIFSTPNKGKAKGLEDLQKIVAKISLPIIALGGITTAEQLKAVEKSGCFAFASIRYFSNT